MVGRTLCAVACCASASPLLLGQIAPRPSQRVDVNTTFHAAVPAVASDGDLSAAVFVENDPFAARHAVCVVTSDGRGTVWSNPVRVDGGGSASRVTHYNAIHVVGSNVFVAWADDRPALGQWDLYFNRSTDGGVTFDGEQRIDTAFGPGLGSVREWRLAAPNATDLYMFFAVQDATGQTTAFLSASHDGGSTWSSPPTRVDAMPVGSSFDVTCVALAVDPTNAQRVHLAWLDSRGNGVDADAFYRRTDDGGATMATAELQLDTSPIGVGNAIDFVEIAAMQNGQGVGVAWLESGVIDLEEQMQFAWSFDAGATFGPDVAVGGGTVASDDVDWIALDAFGDRFYLAWNDDRTGANLIYVKHAPFTLAPTGEVAVSSDGASFPRFAGAADGSVVGVAFEAALGNPGGPEAAFTTDGGATWSGMLSFGDQPNRDVDNVELAFNGTYRNFVSVWAANTGAQSRNRIFIGGFRPQTCTPFGWDDIYGPTTGSLGFTLQGFGDNTIALVGLSLNPGPVTASDGRMWEMGAPIAPFGGLGFEAVLTNGSGATLFLPNVFFGGAPIGWTVNFGAVGFTAGQPGVGHLTDVFQFDF